MHVIVYSDFSKQYARVDLLENPHSGHTYDVVRIDLAYGSGRAVPDIAVSWDVSDFYYNIEVPVRINLPDTAVLHDSEVTVEDMKRMLTRYSNDLQEAKKTIAEQDAFVEHIRQLEVL